MSDFVPKNPGSFAAVILVGFVLVSFFVVPVHAELEKMTDQEASEVHARGLDDAMLGEESEELDPKTIDRSLSMASQLTNRLLTQLDDRPGVKQSTKNELKQARAKVKTLNSMVKVMKELTPILKEIGGSGLLKAFAKGLQQ